jgi:16S rRNA (guanine527-N7)-methyltransferase
MLELEMEELLKKGVQELGLELPLNTISKFFKYKELVLEWNKKVNLTSIEDDKEFIIKHFVDSLTLAPLLNIKNGSLIDVGTGAGFPGIPLKILLSNLEVTLLDSLDKRVRFLNTVIEELSIQGINAIHFRAEDGGHNSNYREKFDFAVARAVASLPVLLEYCLPFVKVGGVFFAMKGLSEDEVSLSKKALQTLGGEILEIKKFQLPLTDNQRNIIVIKKFRQTPTNYPRKAGKPSKNPL